MRSRNTSFHKCIRTRARQINGDLMAAGRRAIALNRSGPGQTRPPSPIIEARMDLPVQPADPGEVTVLLRQISDGDAHAIERLIPLVLHELRRLAKLQLRNERPDHTLQPTALVNEAYIRLVSDQARDWQSRAHFIGVSASVMRRILVDHARRKQALKRGGLSRSAVESSIMRRFPINRRRNCSP